MLSPGQGASHCNTAFHLRSAWAPPHATDSPPPPHTLPPHTHTAAQGTPAICTHPSQPAHLPHPRPPAQLKAKEEKLRQLREAFKALEARLVEVLRKQAEE